ncbi:MAG: type II toxin-antitoxin system HicA family toxin [Candidatus Helarchaeota archaeon]
MTILKKLGFQEVRQKGSHVRIEKKTDKKTLKITVPLHKELKKKTLKIILKYAEISIEELSKYI